MSTLLLTEEGRALLHYLCPDNGEFGCVISRLRKQGKHRANSVDVYEAFVTGRCNKTRYRERILLRDLGTVGVAHMTDEEVDEAIRTR